MSKFIILFAIFACAFAAQVRFINNLQGQTITIKSVELGDIPLAYQAISSYTNVTGNITIAQVNNGQVNFNSAPILLHPEGYTTFVASYNIEGNFVFLKFTEQAPAEGFVENGQSYVRLVSLGGAVGMISVAVGNNIIFEYVPQLTATQYKAIPAGSNNLNIFQSGGMIANTYPLNYGTGFAANNVYTIYLFTPSSGPNVFLSQDRAVSESTTSGTSSTGTPSSSSTGTTPSSSTGTPSSVTSGRVTPSGATTGSNVPTATTQGQVISGTIDPEDSSAATVSVSLAVAAFAILAL
jgi:hypothetical protein